MTNGSGDRGQDPSHRHFAQAVRAGAVRVDLRVVNERHLDESVTTLLSKFGIEEAATRRSALLASGCCAEAATSDNQPRRLPWCVIAASRLSCLRAQSRLSVMNSILSSSMMRHVKRPVAKAPVSMLTRLVRTSGSRTGV